MRVMAVDYGDARTGVAVSDLTRTLTGDTLVIENRKFNEVAAVIIDEAVSRNVNCIVVGYPKNMDGSIGPRAEKSELLINELCLLLTGCEKQDDIEVKLWDERMTTLGAQRVLTEVGKFGKKRKKSIDAVAASLILESYLGSIG